MSICNYVFHNNLEDNRLERCLVKNSYDFIHIKKRSFQHDQGF